MIQSIFKEHKHSTLDAIRAHYGSIPSLKETQMLDLGEPEPTPQQRTRAKRKAKMAKDSFPVLDNIATGSQADTESMSGNSGMGWMVADGEMTAMGQAIGEDDMAFTSDEGFFGVMQHMWARSK